MDAKCNHISVNHSLIIPHKQQATHVSVSAMDRLSKYQLVIIRKLSFTMTNILCVSVCFTWYYISVFVVHALRPHWWYFFSNWSLKLHFLLPFFFLVHWSSLIWADLSGLILLCLFFFCWNNTQLHTKCKLDLKKKNGLESWFIGNALDVILDGISGVILLSWFPSLLFLVSFTWSWLVECYFFCLLLVFWFFKIWEAENIQLTNKKFKK